MIIFVGVSGTGKSVQGKLLAQQRGCPYISIGELFRGKLSDEEKAKMLAGKFLGDAVTSKVFQEALNELPADKQCVVDGFPRTLGQAEWLVEQVEKGSIKLEAFIRLVVDREVVLGRLKRGRADDTPEAIKQRFKEFDRTIIPILNFVRGMGIDVQEIDGMGTVDAVNDRIRKAINL